MNTNTTNNTTTVTLRRGHTNRRTGVVVPDLTVEINFNDPDLSIFHYPETCYNVEAKEIKIDADAAFNGFKKWCGEQARLLGSPEWLAKEMDSYGTMPGSVGTCGKHAVKNLHKRFDNEFKKWFYTHKQFDTNVLKSLKKMVEGGLQAFVELNKHWKANKARLIKGNRKNDESKAKKAARVPWGQDQVALAELNKMAAPTKELIRKNELDRMNGLIARIEEMRGEQALTRDLSFNLRYSEEEWDAARAEDRGRDEGYKGFPGYKQAESNRMAAVNSRWRKNVVTLFASNFYPLMQDQLNAKAVQHANDVWECFLGKMESKIGGLGITKVNAVGGNDCVDQWTCLLTCEARNGVTFELNNAIVFKTSPLGNLFQQFPARFTSVHKDGQPVKHSATLEAVRGLCGPTAGTC